MIPSELGAFTCSLVSDRNRLAAFYALPIGLTGLPPRI